MRLSLKAVNAELAKRGFDAVVAKGSDYFYFSGGEATVVFVARLSVVDSIPSLSLVVAVR